MKEKQRIKAAKDSRFGVRPVWDLAETESATSTVKWILCRRVERVAERTDFWLGVLSAHHANQGLLAKLKTADKRHPNVYAAVFAIDARRTTARLIHQLTRAGVGGVINFPSSSFINAEADTVLNSLSLGINREIDFLAACSKEGLPTGGGVRSAPAALRLLNIGVDFFVAYGGPLTHADPNPDREVQGVIAQIANPNKVPVIGTH